MLSLKQIIEKNSSSEFLVKSRIHKEPKYFKSNNLFMKRDDEIGFGISGSKVRKFASLIKSISDQKPDWVVVEGSLNSNNVLGLSSLLNSSNIKFKLALPKSNSAQMGNAIWIESIYKDEVLEIENTNGLPFEKYAQLLKSDNLFVIKEGAAQIESVAGLLNLGNEIMEYEKANNQKFNAIYIDAGTGITAISVVLAYAFSNHSPKFYITLIAGTKNEFVKLMQNTLNEFNSKNVMDLSLNLENITFLEPPSAKSFGSINATIKNEWQFQMKELGYPIDLTYTAKHFFTVKEHLKKQPNNQYKLIINCGSWHSARNHEHLLQKTTNKNV